MGKMHADELDIDPPLVARLIATQFPQWADLPLSPVRSAGTDNAIYRLGDEMAVRLPRIAGAVGDVEKEQCWLPRLSPHLPLAIPTPLGLGRPDEGYPWPWSVCRWLDGESAQDRRIPHDEQVARDLADFIAALQRIDTAGWPSPGPPNSPRGGPLSRRDANTRAAIAALSGRVDTADLTLAWEAAIQAPGWDGPPVWTHGDLLPGNLLVHDGRISAVIDFGCLGIGDPACDLIAAWALLSAPARAIFREALAVDEATWARGRGWALSIGLIALPYYQDTNSVFAATASRMIAEVLAEHALRPVQTQNTSRVAK
jgi:aminoglycoside phosphotransferase (APT) family kinase protein